MPSAGAVTEIPREQITGIVLAGGRGMRMGGVDKGLQLFNGMPLALHALNRLQPQVGSAMLVANRHRVAYQAFGVPVWADGQCGESRCASVPDYAGPLAGFLAGLTHCSSPWLLTVPCDTPHFPLDLAERLAHRAAQTSALIAMATDGLRPQPVFCLLHRSLIESLDDFLTGGGRKIGAWTALHDTVRVPFEHVEDFVNINSLDELRALEG